MGWDALEQWGDNIVRIAPLAGGVANDVWSLRVNGQLAVGRSVPGATLTSHGRPSSSNALTVEVSPCRSDPDSGRPAIRRSLVVMTYVEGGPPETQADWRRVADTLRVLHGLTQGWPQRPGWRSSTDLLHAQTGTKIDLGTMPPEAVARCRAAWARFAGRETCVVHGDPNQDNVRMTADRVALIDWDESHVDVPDLDLVLPHNAAGLETAPTRSPRKHRPHGKPPSAGTTITQPSDSLRFGRSETSRPARRSGRFGLDRLRPSKTLSVSVPV